MADPKVTILIQAKNLAGAVIKTVQTQFTHMRERVGEVFKSLTGIIGLAFAGIGIEKFFEHAMAEAKENERVNVLLGQSIENLGLNYQALSPHVQEVTEHLARLSGRAHTEVNEALSQMVTITGDLKGSLDKLPLAVDIAAKKHMSLAEAGDLVGRAMVGQTRVLRQLGITTKDTDKAFEIMQKRFGGMAAVEMTTFEGMARRVTVRWGEFLENIGLAIIRNEEMRNGMERLGKWMETVVDRTVELDSAVFKVAATFRTVGNAIKMVVLPPLAAIITVAGTVGGVLRLLAIAFSYPAEAVAIFSNAVVNSLNFVDTAIAKLKHQKPPKLLPTIDLKQFADWRKAQVDQIDKNGVAIKQAWIAAGDAIGEGIAEAQLDDEKAAAFRAGVPGGTGKLPNKIATFAEKLASKDKKEVAAATREVKEEEERVTEALKRGNLAERERNILLERQADLQNLLKPPRKLGKDEEDTKKDPTQDEKDRARLKVLVDMAKTEKDNAKAVAELTKWHDELNARIAKGISNQIEDARVRDLRTDIEKELLAIGNLAIEQHKKLDEARKNEIGGLLTLVELRKADGAQILRLYELQDELTKALRDENAAIKAGNGDLAHKVALEEQLAALREGSGIKPVKTRRPVNDTEGPRVEDTKPVDSGAPATSENKTIFEEAMRGVGNGFDDVIGKVDEFSKVLAQSAGGAIREFEGTALDAFEKVGSGQLKLGQAFGQAVRSGVAAAARHMAQYYMILASAKVGEALGGNPAALAAAAKFFAAAAAFSILAGAVSPTGSGGGAGGSSRESGLSNVNGNGAQKPVTVYFPSGVKLHDTSDPRQVEAFKKFFEDITDREVIIRTTSR